VVFGLAARRGRTTLAAVFFPAGVGVGFVFITAIPCFALNSWPEKSYGGNLPGAMGIFRQVVNNFLWITFIKALASRRAEVFFISRLWQI
jgi:hypothetical protein